MNDEINQKFVLRMVDVAGLAWIAFVVVFYLATYTLPAISYFTLVCAFVELSICLIFAYKAWKLKQALIVKGEWKKLSFKEKFDLHEWRQK